MKVEGMEEEENRGGKGGTEQSIWKIRDWRERKYNLVICIFQITFKTVKLAH